jgi:tRNA(Ile)-lysidine synthase TilS/MesJ
MKRCSRCALPETFPGISFDEEGICSVCRDYDASKQEDPSNEDLLQKFEQIIEETRGRGEYDALVAYSGGKDSTYLIHKLQEKYGLSILAFTLDNGFMPAHTFRNMTHVVEKLNVDHLVLKLRQDRARRIFRVSAENIVYPQRLLKFGSSVCISCIRMVTNLSLKTAIEKRIPLVMMGHSPGQLLQSQAEVLYKDNRIPLAMKRSLFNPLAKLAGEDIYHYLTLNEKQYKTADFPYLANPFPLLDYDESEIYHVIEKLGWSRPKDVDANSSNCQLNAYGITMHLERHEYHPYDYEMSLLVRSGVISREEAVRRIEGGYALAKEISNQVLEKLAD